MNTVNVLFVHSKCTVCTQYGFEVIKDWFYVIRVFDKDCIDSLNNIVILNSMRLKKNLRNID